VCSLHCFETFRSAVADKIILRTAHLYHQITCLTPHKRYRRQLSEIRKKF
jgi:hypothetical protein